MEVPHDLGHVALRLDDPRPVPTSHERPVSPIPAVEPLRVNAVDVLHRPVEPTAFVLDEDVVVRRHQAIRVRLDVPSARAIVQQQKKPRATFVVDQDLPAVLTAVHHVMPQTRLDESECPTMDL